MRILHLEDSSSDAELIAVLLAREWPSCAVNKVETRAQYVAALEVGDFDVILSDYTMGSFDGLSALELARVWCPEKPFIFLSGTIGEDRAVEALKRGAMDYVIKDRPGRLIPAIRQAIARIEEGRQHRMTAEALRQNRERFREITENVADLVVLLDLDGRRLYHNPSYAKALGGAAELIGTSFFANVHSDDRQRIWDDFTEMVRSGIGRQSEYRIIRQDGAPRYIESHDSVICDRDGNVTHVLVVARDVTDRRAAEERIHEQAALLDKTQDAILVRDLNHRITYWNKGAERLYGWTASEALGQNATLLLMPESSLLKTACDEALARGEWLGELRHHTKSGSEVVVQSRWTLMRLANGAPSGFLIIDTDVTDKMQLEAQFLRAQRMESMGMLVSGIAHDLNNVLAPILMSAGLLKLTAPESDRRLVATIEAGAQHGASMVRQLLSFARGTEGRHSELNLCSLLVDFEKFIRPTLPASILVETKILTEPPPVRADATQLNQVLMNLCINARDAMSEDGMITLSLDYIRLDRTHALAQIEGHHGPYAVLMVTDTGAGIPPEILDRIFDPFFTTKGEGQGTGLGLSTVRGIVKGHGGFLTVDSKIGRGTTFRIYLPAVLSPPSALLPSSASTAGRSTGILLVDDEPMILSALELVLADEGYRVFTALSAKEALGIFEASRSELHLIVTDIRLKDANEMEFIRALRARDPHCPIIAISGVVKSSQFEKDLRAIGVPFLAKPIKGEALLAAVKSVLKARPPA
ncbi:MAG TPA: PAS domain S-box protein [Opitutaceae bacterium]|jgi:PAS domain S-box-containing protein|nr:PAS domain S-box protein [Opitutaceae bacterium]